MAQKDLRMRKAIIDLGTNTFNLLIGELIDDELKIIHSEKIPVMLGMGGINEGKIAPDAYQRGLAALTAFKQKAQTFEVDHIKGIATSAVRSATNGKEFIAQTKSDTGIDIVLVDGMAEAELIYKGVSLTTDIDDDVVIMDIGGGSTEFIHVVKGEIAHIDSLNIGVSRLFQMLDKPEDYSELDFDRVLDFIEDQSEGHFNYKCKRLIGASGTFETFYEMINQKKYVCEGKAMELNWGELQDTLDWSMEANFSDRQKHPWIIDMRKGMLPIGAFKVKWIIQKLGIEEAWLSPYSLKEGAFIS
jgi:exopolyphosphatase/guanosine-5'-triphosphate,3'-diphosphate pyrophosphatase